MAEPIKIVSPTSADSARSATLKDYDRRGFGGRYGFGDRSALVVIDMARAFNDPHHPIGANQDSAVDSISELLVATRELGIRTFFFTTAFHPDLHDAGGWIRKVPVIGTLQLGTPDVEIDDRLQRRDSEPLIVKKASSCFFGTPFETWLRSEGIDTLIVTPNHNDIVLEVASNNSQVSECTVQRA